MRKPLVTAIALVFSHVLSAQSIPGKSADLLDSVVVVGQRRPEPIEQVVGAVSRIDRATIERRSVQDIHDLVRYTPGVEVSQEANRFGNQSFSIRGLEGNRVSIEIDGVPLPDAFSVGQFAAAGRDLVELGVIDHVEILRGPASTLYGSKALAGVLAYHTLDPSNSDFSDQSWRVGAALGSQSRDESQRWAAHWMGQSDDGRFDFLLAAGRRSGHESANAADDSEYAPNPADYTRDSGMLKFGLDLAEVGRWQLVFDRSEGRQQTDVQSLLFGPGRFSTTYALTGDDTFRRNRVSVQGTVADVGALNDLSVLLYRQDSTTQQASAQYRLADRTTRFPSLRERDFILDQKSTGLEVNAQWRGEWLGVSHWHIFGIDAVRHDYSGIRYGTETNLLTGAQSQTILGEVLPVRDFPNSIGEELGVFWQDEVRLTPAWTVIPGLRWESQRTRGEPDAIWAADNPGAIIARTGDSALSPKLGLRWSGADWSSYLQLTRGFRAPPFSDVNIGLNLPAFNYVALPNPDLEPERSSGLEWGIRYGGAGFQLQWAFYDNRYSNLIESRANLGINASGQLVFQSVNRDRARIYGTEFDAVLGLNALSDGAAAWRLTAAGSWAHGDDTERDLPLNSVMPAKAVLGLEYAPYNGRWGGELLFTGVAAVKRIDRSSADLFAPPGYSVLDAHLWFAIRPELRLNLSFSNLGNRRYWQWSGMRGVLNGAADLDFYSEAGSNFALSLIGDW